jgi:DNA-binding CsgD family transcriptional regulator
MKNISEILQMKMPEFESTLDELTKRQKRVIRPFLNGVPDQIIAGELGLDRTTISVHINNVCRKFGLENEDGSHYSYREELILIFVKFKPEWVCAKYQTHSQLFLSQNSSTSIEFPGSPLSITSPLYIYRDKNEPYINEILRPGAFVRIRAPRKMGKTSLLNRIYANVTDGKFHPVLINLCDVERRIASDLGSLLQWFSSSINDKLNLNINRQFPANKSDCRVFMQNQVLNELKFPLILIVDNADWLFDYPDIAKEFFPMFRGWHELARDPSCEHIWKNLNIVIAHSTNNYIKFKNSPFENCGVVVRLRQFLPAQIKELSRLYDVSSIGESEIQNLSDFFNGHPYLIQMALYHLSTQKSTLTELLTLAPTLQGIYRTHLEEISSSIKSQPPLIEALQTVIASDGNIHLDSEQRMKLEGLGLIELVGNRAKLSCQLYRLFFQDLF